MAKYKRLTLNGGETEIHIKGRNCGLRNDSAAPVLAGYSAGISDDSENVLMIPAGASAVMHDCDGHLFLKGTGKIQLAGTDCPENPFRSCLTPSEGEDSTARAAIAAHAANTANPHNVTAAQLGISRPNLLRNPDFRINQRGLESYSGVGYTVDGWKNIYNHVTLTCPQDSDHISVTVDNNTGIAQYIESPSRFAGKRLTFSVRLKLTGDYANLYLVDSTGHFGAKSTLGSTEDYITLVLTTSGAVPEGIETLGAVISGKGVIDIKWAKLETGDTATEFTAPEPALELLKCQRYYQIRSTGDISPADLRPMMRDTPGITAVSGGYAYSAELN